MIINMPYWSRVCKNFLYIILLLTGLFLSIKLSVFYMPFLVAFIISLIIEPFIKIIMKKTKLTRRTSSIIIFLIVSILIILVITWLIFTVTHEISILLNSLNSNIDKIYLEIEKMFQFLNIENLEMSTEVTGVINTSINDVLNTVTNYLRTFLTNIFEIITSLPAICISIGITVLALYFICVDKIYIVDQMEHHLPELWVKKIGIHFREINKSLSGFIKAEIILVLISFVISLIGLYLLEYNGFEIPFPLLMAILIGFVDALPILRLWNSNDSMGYIFSFKW